MNVARELFQCYIVDRKPKILSHSFEIVSVLFVCVKDTSIYLLVLSVNSTTNDEAPYSENKNIVDFPFDVEHV